MNKTSVLEAKLKARSLVVDYFNRKVERTGVFTLDIGQVVVVGFDDTRSSGHWEAHLETTTIDNMIYVVEYNPTRDAHYIHAYKQWDTELIHDEAVKTCADRDVDPTEAAIEELTEALRHTVDYIGVFSLPALPGWSWYDAMMKYAPEKAAAFKAGYDDIERNYPTEEDTKSAGVKSDGVKSESVNTFADDKDVESNYPDHPVIGPECFTNRDRTVIAYQGANYYRACDAVVTRMYDDSTSHCVKRVGHPSKKHEDFYGNKAGN